MRATALELVLHTHGVQVDVVATRYELEAIAVPLSKHFDIAGQVVAETRAEAEPEAIFVPGRNGSWCRGDVGPRVGAADLAEDIERIRHRKIRDEADVHALGFLAATVAVRTAGIDVAELQPKHLRKHSPGIHLAGEIRVIAFERPYARRSIVASAEVETDISVRRVRNQRRRSAWPQLRLTGCRQCEEGGGAKRGHRSYSAHTATERRVDHE